MSAVKIREDKDSGISFHSMKKVEIIVTGDHESDVVDLMNSAKVSGFTLIRNVSGMGHGGFHEGMLLYNDQATLVMFLAVAPEDVIVDLATGMKRMLEKSSGVMFVSEVAVARVDYFIKK